MFFSSDTSFFHNSSSPISENPQIEYTGPPVTDSVSWTRISGIFTAQGNEKYLTIGNFRDNGSTQYTSSPCYYFLENVSLVPVRPQGLPQGGDVTIGQGGSVRLSKVTDTLADYQWSPTKGLSNPTVSDPIASPEETTTYTVTKTTHCTTTTAEVTVHVEPPLEEQLYIPNVFSPNAQGDAENRKFRVHGGPFKKYHLQVFSRWGEMVFETKDPGEAWKGRYKGEPVKGGVYSYQFRGVLEDGTEVERSGTVTLLR